MYIQVTLQAEEKQQEELMAGLADFNPNGFEQKGTELIAYFNKNDFGQIILDSLKGFRYEVAPIKEQNWNAVWESNFQPVIVDNFCAVRAHFHQPIPAVHHEIIITPKMSFGTGHHATTYMMMQQIQEINFVGKKVFDFGTGTGVLAILAEKCGAATISAVDVDDWSIKNAQENIERNNCSRITLSLSSSIPNEQFDIILANINRNVILQYLPYLKGAIKNRGSILFSGLLAADEQDILQACNDLHLELHKKMIKDNWISLLLISRC